MINEAHDPRAAGPRVGRVDRLRRERDVGVAAGGRCGSHPAEAEGRRKGPDAADVVETGEAAERDRAATDDVVAVAAGVGGRPLVAEARPLEVV